MKSLVVFKKTDCCAELVGNCLLGTGVLGHSLGALRDGVLLFWKKRYKTYDN